MFLPSGSEQNDRSKCVSPQLRLLAARLLAAADTLDRQLFGAHDVKAFSYYAVDAGTLMLAVAEYQGRRKRSDFISSDLLAEPAWDILLHLFISNAQGKKTTVSDACRASAVPDTTALRWLAALRARGLIDRKPHQFDKRVDYVFLSESGNLAILNWLGYRAALPV